jgi:mRNA interferase RelE/StbE
VSWDYRVSERALKELRKLGSEASHRILAFLDERIRDVEDPRQFGKALRGELGEFWRYRVGDYRLLCQIKDSMLIVLVVKVGHRRDIYR